MTIKEFSELLDVSTDTVTRAAKSLFPNRFSQGKAAVFTVAESKQIITAIKHKGILSQNAELLPQNAEVAKAVDAQTGKGELWLAGLLNPVASRLLQ